MFGLFKKRRRQRSRQNGYMGNVESAKENVTATPGAMPTATPEPTVTPQDTRSPVVALALIVFSFFVWTGFQTLQLIQEKQNLKTLRAAQETPMQNSLKVRNQLDAIAAETAKLADRGNPNARLLVEELRKRGVTINPNAQAQK